MSSSVVGSLRVNLGLDSAQFERGAKRVRDPLRQMRNQFALVAAGAAAFGAAISAAARQGAAEIDATAKAARRLDASITGFRALELVADEAGVSLSALTNDVQSMNREIANIGVSGNADRALERLGISVSELTGLDADEKIAVIADRVQDLGLSAGEATAVLRDLGVRNREMALLVLAGGEAFRNARLDIEEYGLALDQVDSDRIEAANDAIGRLGLIAQYARQQIALQLTPALGQMATALTDSLREGGALRAVIDGLADNIQRLGTWVAVAVAGFGTRFVAALVLARLATFSLSGALLFLRGAIFRTGIGILVVGAGELVYWFSRLITAAGGFGEALSALKDVGIEVWDRLGEAGAVLLYDMRSVAQGIQGAFLAAFADIVSGFASVTQALADAGNGLLGVFGIEGNRTGIGAEYAESLRETSDELLRLSQGNKNLGDQLAQDLRRPLTSIERLREMLRATTEDTEGGAEAAARLGDALDEVEDKSGGAATCLENVEDAADDVGQEAKAMESSFASAFSDIITGAKSAREALSNLLSSFASILARSAGESIFGAIAGGIGIPGFATGTSFAPGGLALVGERGPELVNLPRGSQVFTNAQSRGMVGNSATVINIDARGAVEGVAVQIERAIQRQIPGIVQASVAVGSERRLRGRG